MQKLSNAQYHSVTDFLASLNELANPANAATRDNHTLGDCGGGKGWLGAGCPDGAAVQKKLANGWPEGRAKLLKLMGEIDATALVPMDMRRRIVRCELGDSVDIHSVYSGNLATAWTRAKRKTGLAPQRIDILANMLCSGHEEPDVLFWRGAAAIVLCDLVETAGYMVRLTIGFGGDHYSGGKVSCRITVKEHGMPLDVTTTAATLLPGFFRALGHGWIAAHNPKVCGSPGISVGQCDADMDSPEIFLTHTVRDKATALAWLKEQVREINERYAPQEAA